MRLPFILLAGASLTMAADGWRQVPGHPELEYRLTCLKGTDLSVVWRNGYPGEVSLTARVRSETYDGVDQTRVAPGGTTKMDTETMSCSLGSASVSVLKFSMAAPPPPKREATAKAADKPKEEPEAPPVPTLLRFDPNAEKLPQIAAEKLAEISTGMKLQDVLGKLGPPASKIETENDGEFVASYQYRLGGDKISVVRFSNGTVTEIIRP
jgi:sulfur carrier protein ThiS